MHGRDRLGRSAEVTAITALLSAAEIRSAFGARDLWQVVDHVSARDLGGAHDIARYRTMSTAGNTIMGWLARRARDLERSRPLVFRRAPGRPGASRPTDAELVAACEAWLEAAAMS